MEEYLTRQHGKIKDHKYPYTIEYGNLLKCHRHYPKDNFRSLSERLIEEVNCRNNNT